MTATQVSHPNDEASPVVAAAPLVSAETLSRMRASGAPSLRESRELLVNLTLREIRSKYKRTALGHIWSLLNPLSVMLMYTLVFSVILPSNPPKGDPSGVDVYALFLMCGLLPWTFFSSATVSGMGALVANANLLKKVYFRRDVLVAAGAFSWLVTFVIEIGVLLIALLAFGGMPLPWIPLVLVAIALLSAFALGLGLLLSVLHVYFRDTEHFTNIVFLLWFYLTPVIYPIQRVEHALNKPHYLFGWKLPLYTLYQLNPMERFVAVFRSLLYDNTWPALTDFGFCLGSAAVALGIGIFVFRRFEARVTEEL